MVVSDRLTFLAKYREFHGMSTSGNLRYVLSLVQVAQSFALIFVNICAFFRNAAASLHSLVKFKVAPKYFWITLLIDALPFLAENVTETINSETSVFFSSEQTYDLMGCLHELQNEKESLPAKQKNLVLEYELELRRRLGR